MPLPLHFLLPACGYPRSRRPRLSRRKRRPTVTVVAEFRSCTTRFALLERAVSLSGWAPVGLQLSRPDSSGGHYTPAPTPFAPAGIHTCRLHCYHPRIGVCEARSIPRRLTRMQICLLIAGETVMGHCRVPLEECFPTARPSIMPSDSLFLNGSCTFGKAWSSALSYDRSVGRPDQRDKPT